MWSRRSLPYLMRSRTSQRCTRYSHAFDAMQEIASLPGNSLTENTAPLDRRNLHLIPYTKSLWTLVPCVRPLTPQDLPLSDKISWAARNLSIMQTSSLFRRSPAPLLYQKSLKPGRLQMEWGTIQMMCMQRSWSNSNLMTGAFWLWSKYIIRS